MNSNTAIIRYDQGVPEVKVTSDYSIFHRMEGNREVTSRRAMKIRQSIEDVGYIPAPIIVNEGMEVVDGQGRLDALRQLNLPVYFIVIPGLELRDCVAMNINTTSWGLRDYVDSYAEKGIEDYIRLKRLIESFDLPLTVVLCAATGVLASANGDAIKGGTLSLTEDFSREIEHMLAYVQQFKKVMNEHGVSGKASALSALCFCYQCEKVDNARLLHAFTHHYYRLTNSTKIDDIMRSLSEIYNFNRSKNKVYIEVEYREYLDDKYPWYASYWGKR